MRWKIAIVAGLVLLGSLWPSVISSDGGKLVPVLRELWEAPLGEAFFHFRYRGTGGGHPSQRMEISENRRVPFARVGWGHDQAGSMV